MEHALPALVELVHQGLTPIAAKQRRSPIAAYPDQTCELKEAREQREAFQCPEHTLVEAQNKEGPE